MCVCVCVCVWLKYLFQGRTSLNLVLDLSFFLSFFLFFSFFLSFFLWFGVTSQVGLCRLLLKFLDHAQLDAHPTLPPPLSRTHARTHAGSRATERAISRSQSPLLTQHRANTSDQHPCPQWDSNPQSQQSSGFRPTPSTVRPPGSAGFH